MKRFLFLVFFTFLVAAGGAARAEPLRDIAYGTHPLQRFDLYLPVRADAAPLVIMLHGGGWRIGDKGNARIWESKVAHWMPQGVAFAAVNTRLLPDADPISQARDLAAAVAYIQANAPQLGIDRSRIVVMGHSAGAHVAALMATRDDLRSAAGVRPFSGTVVLDTAALDLAAVMAATPPRIYRRAFGAEQSYWEAASPMTHLSAGDGPFLIICSAPRHSPCAAARSFAGRAAEAGIAATILPMPFNHMQVNALVGAEARYTAAIDRWLDAVWD